jgi:hypothetical protein
MVCNGFFLPERLGNAHNCHIIQADPTVAGGTSYEIGCTLKRSPAIAGCQNDFFKSREKMVAASAHFSR